MNRIYVKLCGWITCVEMDTDSKVIKKLIRMFDWVTVRIERLHDRLINQ